MTTDDEMTEESTTEASDADTPEAAPTDSEAAEAVASEPVATEKESAPAAAEAPDTGAEVADEAQGEAQGEAYDPTVGGAAAHLLGISRPQDEYGTREIDRDAMSDEELLAMGVEVDDGPGAKLIGVFLALAIVLILSGVAAAALFGWVRDAKRAGLSNRVHPTLAGARDEAAEVLNAYEQLEAAEDSTAAPGFRVPIDVAMDILVENDRLLARHPMGASEAALEPPAFEGFEPPQTGRRTVPSGTHDSFPPPTSGGVQVIPDEGEAPRANTVGGVPAQPAINVAPVDPHAGHGHDDHAGHGHDDHAEHGHDDHAGHGHDDHAGHDHQ